MGSSLSQKDCILIVDKMIYGRYLLRGSLERYFIMY